MDKFIAALKALIEHNPPDLGDCDSVLSLLYEAYNEINPMDDPQIKADFHQLYELMNGMPLRDMDKINEVLNNSNVEFVSMSKPFVAQPDFLADWKANGEGTAICQSCNNCYSKKKSTHTTNADAPIRIIGKPYLKYQCFVLCRNQYIPRVVPREPPSRATRNSVLSLIRHAPFFALRLSDHITNKPSRLMINK